tara:strand:+ start:22 stop:681 length:660 start_codon:yes stop_codon:yes gene_type:complete
MKNRFIFIVGIIAFIMSTFIHGQSFTIARIHYGGGGDWYSDPSSLPNLLKFLRDNTNIAVADDEVRFRPTDQEFYRYPYLYLTGHGNVRFTEEEILKIRETLLRGAFLHADDNYGMDVSFREEMKRVFPNRDFIELPFDHPIFNVYYNFSSGLPKVHEHDGKPPQALGIFDEERLMVLYTYECDLGDGWEDAEVHNNPEETRLKALQMGVNIIYYSMVQ